MNLAKSFGESLSTILKAYGFLTINSEDRHDFSEQIIISSRCESFSHLPIKCYSQPSKKLYYSKNRSFLKPRTPKYGVKTTIQELAEMILEVTGSHLKIQYEPGGTTFVKNRVGCPKKATSEIGFTAKAELREGIKNLIEWRNTHKEDVEMRRLAAGLKG